MFISGKNVEPLYGFYWFKPFIDRYCYTTAMCKLFLDVVCLSYSCSNEVNKVNSEFTYLEIETLACYSIN